ncbi:MAG: SusD/RagB family nutrient-binding outer membrane lipoprotein [Mucilaginibacter sp.]
MKKIYIYTLSTLLLWGAAGCKKLNDFGNTNVDPTAVVTPVISALIADVEHNLAGYVSTQSYAINGAAYAQYMSETQYPGTSLYDLPQVDFTPQYAGTHDANNLPVQAGNLFDCQTVINVATNKNSVAAATIMQQYLYWTLTDAYGDIPYSQALKGINAITPAYDTQEDIYKGILTKTAAAVAALGEGSVEGDVVYGGNTAQWKKFGNSLIILAAIQLDRKVPGASDYAATAFNAAVNGGYIATNADNFAVPFELNYHNPWFALYDGRTDWAESNTVTNMTKALNDGRTVAWGGAFNDPAQTAGGKVTSDDGVPYGLNRTDANNYISANPDWALVLRADHRTQSTPVNVISAAQVTLAIAEGMKIGWTGGSAATTYRNGILLSFEEWGVTAPADSYFTQGGVVFSAKNLATQQWLASYPNGHMGWNIWRKTGYPILTPAPGATSSEPNIIRRFVYSSTESQTNGTNYAAAVAREVGPKAGTDSQDNAVWWDVIGQGTAGVVQ